MASSIPNLNTLKRGGPRLRGRRGPSALQVEEQPVARSQDQIVQGTDHDASSSRLSAVELGYLEDEYAAVFATSAGPAPRRFPIINRGTYVRTTAIDLLVRKFLAANEGKQTQIISLGAGSDTRFFRLGKDVLYHEIDFDVNIEVKEAAIQRSPALTKELSSSSAKLLLHRLDLRGLDGDSAHQLPGLLHDAPTLLLSECCLCYFIPQDAERVLDYFTRRLTGSLGIVLYEPIRPDDAFGRTMVSNLASRGIQLQTISKYGSLELQRERLLEAGFTSSQNALDVYQIWQNNSWIAENERERVEKLEWLDEIEEWKLLASHYCVAWASRGEHFDTAWSGLNNAT